MKLLSILLLTLVLVFPSLAQLQFEKTNYDFGKIKEVDGPVEYEFVFTNAGTAPVLITNVKASCGCTTPGWSKDTIQPGGKGFVKALYNPHNRPGSFNKSLTVYTNSEPSTWLLTFTGFVIAKQNTMEEEYPVKIGALRFNEANVNFGRISTKGPETRTILVFNDSKTSVKFQKKNDLPGFIKVELPESVEPEKSAEIKVTYDPVGKEEFGPVQDNFTIFTTETENNKKTLSVSADIYDYIPANLSTEEAAKLQKIDLKTRKVEFGSISSGTSSIQEVEIKNTGKADLIIRKLKTNAAYISVETDKKVVKPGAKVKLKITYASGGFLGRDAKSLTIYTNDPAEPVIDLAITAEVVKGN